MVPTVFLDWGLSFGVGVLFALAGRGEPAPRGRLRTRSFRWGLAYLHVGVLAISISLYAMNRDWMWMYWIDPRALPVGIEILAFALYEVCFVAGFLLAAELSPRSGAALAVATAAAIALLEVTARTRLFRFGSLEEFRAGAAAPAIRFSPWTVAPEWWLVSIGGAASLVALALILVRVRAARLAG